MSVAPEGDALRKAIRWVGEQRRERPEARLSELVDRAGKAFDLSPTEAEWLWTMLTERRTSA